MMSCRKDHRLLDGLSYLLQPAPRRRRDFVISDCHLKTLMGCEANEDGVAGDEFVCDRAHGPMVVQAGSSDLLYTMVR
jgi:hypothetical protein